MMRPPLFVIAGLLAGLVLASAARAADGQQRALDAGADLIGTPAPALKIHTLEGTEIDLGRLYGHTPVYLKFWATWCVPCRQQMPHFEKTYERLHQDMAVIAVNTGFNDTVADIETYRARMGLTMPIVLDDGRLARAFHLRVTPQHIVIGRDGRILYVGHLVDEPLEQALASAVAEKPAMPASVQLATSAPLAAGEAVGEIRVKATDGTVLWLADPAKSVRTVLAFISPWCESYLATSRPQRAQACEQARVSIEEFVKTHPQTRIIGLASGLWADQSDVLEYQHDHHALSIPLAVDDSGELFRRFGVRDVPTFIVLDADGRVRTKSDRFPAGAVSTRSASAS